MDIREMKEVRLYSSLIHKARVEAGFKSLKYPIIDVKVNRYFLPEHRKLIADECHVYGYYCMETVGSLHDGIPAVEFDPQEFDSYKDRSDYFCTSDASGREVCICTVTSDWQNDIYNERKKSRVEAVKRKTQEEVAT